MFMKRTLFTAMLTIAALTTTYAQRQTDQLDRGLVAVKTTSGVYCSWRIMGEEYYDVKYNLYRDGTKVNSEPLNVSNYVDAAGTESSKYTVKAVVRGTEQTASQEATVWSQSYLEITPDHGSLTSTYIPNDACMADVDGDGELEILMKFDNQSWAGTSYQKSGYNGEYFIIEVFKMNGKKLWWVDLGPNMADFQNNEQNIVAYDWDGDGKAEAVMRASDGTVIHMADGTTQVIGDASKNYLGETNTNQWFVHEGNEYLIYMNGETGKPYQVMEYPLKRLENGETDLNTAWGDGYGHRSTKHFFGAPYLDGRKPSIFLARGIYTRHKMIALDVNPTTHELTERWRWNCNTPGSPWYGQGYHNFAVADVDWDGRDEICFGSMVIDDNGKGLSTTGLGHGDAQHHGDFNPYIHGHEIYACNEDAPNNNFRDATTSKIYYRSTSGNDDGRSMCGNFTNDYPGAIGLSSRDEPISCVVNDHITGLTKASANVTQNMRIYWDGDLLEESFDYSNGKNSAGAIYKYGQSGALEVLTGSMTNNDTKGTPCYQGDILGDWREEVMMRTKDNKVRIYTTTIPTEWRIPTLWHDHQYRQAMVWQMCGYNQPPHVSYFLGELEGITQAPPALTMTGRTEVKGGDMIDNSLRDKQVLMAEAADITVNIPQSSVDPYIFFDNAPSWVEGHDDNNNITTRYFTHTLTGGGFNGNMRLVKQGDGILKLPENIAHEYWGDTEIWAGTLVASQGGMPHSAVWINRFGRLESYPESNTRFKSVVASYGSVLSPGGSNTNSSGFAMEKLTLGFGAIVELDVSSDHSGLVYQSPDMIGTETLIIEKKDWQYGPAYSTPVLRIIPHFAEGESNLAPGKYLIMQSSKIEGNISDFVIEGLEGMKCKLESEVKSDVITNIYLVVSSLRSPENTTWDGGTDGIWDFAVTENFKSSSGEKEIFVTGDNVTFNDNASNTTIIVTDELTPGSITFDNSSKDYTVEGTGNIVGNAMLTKKGEASVTINSVNKLTGGIYLQAGKLNVSTLSNSDGVEYGALGGVDNPIVFSGGTLGINGTTVSSQNINIDSNGTIETTGAARLTHNGSIDGSKKQLSKTGTGTLILNGTAKYGTLTIEQGNVQVGEISDVHQYPDTVVLNGGTLKDPDNIYSYSRNKVNIVVPEGKTATWTLDARCDYTGKLFGKGTLTVNVTSVRSNMQGDWSQFEGTLNFQNNKTGQYDPLLQWNNSYGLGKATLTGIFNNNGKNVTVGTILGNANLSGSGTYNAQNLSLKITKVRGTATVTTIEVANTLSVTGDINITLAGTGTPRNGEEFQLWKVGRLTTTTDVKINLPTLPEGLYWDTTDLLKATGILRITDQPTGINAIDADTKNDGKYYTLSGVSVEKPTKKGIYIRNGKKIIIK